MNFLAKILLYIFIFAQAAPSIVSLIDCDKKMSISIIEEEEKAKEEKSKEEKEFVCLNSKEFLFVFNQNSNKNNSKYLIKEYQTTETIEILPPEQI